MADPPSPSYALGELARRVGGEVEGDPATSITGIRALGEAGVGDLSFLTRAGYRDEALKSRAAAILAPPASGLAGPWALLVVDDPVLALARLIEIFHPQEKPAPGLHPTAIVGAGCEIHPSAAVGPYAVIGAGSTIGAGSVIGAHVVVGRRCRLGEGVVVHPHAVLYDRTELGDRVVLHAGVVLGADGFGYATHQGEHVKVPQVGRTVIEDDVEIGALSAVDRALVEATRVGRGTKIDNLVQVGHNVAIGRGSMLCGQVGIAGSARLGDFVVMGGQSGAAGHLTLGDGAQVAGKSAVFESVPAGRKVGGIPAIDLARWRRQVAVLSRIGDWLKRLRKLEKSQQAREDRTPDGARTGINEPEGGEP